MSTDQTRRTLVQLDKDIADLAKKSAGYGKTEATARGNAASIRKGITKNTSPNALRSKLLQIERYESNANKAASSKADVDKKLADKQKKRGDTYSRLQKEEAAERKKERQTQVAIQHDYERRIDYLTTQLRSEAVATPSNNPFTEASSEEFDVFISHASEDKAGFVDDLFQELVSRGVQVWYDTMSIQWGDSLRSKIDEGLRKSRFGLVILSNDYIRKGWTQYELDGLFQREMTGGKTILPIWHKITKDEVQSFSPTLAGRKALNTAMLSAAEIAEELIKLLPPLGPDGTTE